jgi:hypothetical protein
LFKRPYYTILGDFFQESVAEYFANIKSNNLPNKLILARTIIRLYRHTDMSFLCLIYGGLKLYTLDRYNDIPIVKNFDQVEKLILRMIKTDKFVLAYNEINNGFGNKYNLEETKEELEGLLKNLKTKIFLFYVYKFYI